MNKKLLVSMLLCFFVFSSMVYAKEKASVIEFLVREGGFDPNLFEYIPDDFTQHEGFNSGILLTLHVPPSLDSERIFFFLDAQFWYKWTSFHQRRANAIVYFVLKSDIIPEDINVWNGMTLIDISETNNAGEYSFGRERSWRNTRSTMTRNSTEVNRLGEMRVTYKGGGGNVPDEIAIPLLNSLIDNGFDVEIDISGGIKGVKWIRCVGILMEVTRLSKE